MMACKMTRIQPLHFAITLLAATILFTVLGTDAADEARSGSDQSPGNPKHKILLIGKEPDHPFGTHMYLHTCEMLTKCLKQVEGVETVVSNGWPKDPATLKGVKTIVVYATPGAEFLLDGPHGKEVAKLMDEGVGLVTIHWASAIFQKNLDRLGKQWMGYLGGTWVSNVGLSTEKSSLKQLLPDHPVCRGWKGYDLHDEYYLNPTMAEAKPLLQVTAKGKPLTVAWVHERKDGGRAFGTTLGHFYRNFQIDGFRRMIVNGILWTAKVEIPNDGAPVNLSEEELALPEKSVEKSK